MNRLSLRALQSSDQPIGELMAHALQNPDIVSLAAGFVDQESLPVELVQQAFERVFHDPVEARRALQYGTTLGIPALRRYLLENTARADGLIDGYPNTSIEQVVITAGSNQLLSLLADVLCDPGDIVLCASPTYFVVLGTFASIGAVAHGIATDAEGMIPEALDAALEQIHERGELSRVKALYVVSYFDNPRGVTMPRARREAIFAIIQRWSAQASDARGIVILEDAAYRDLRYDDTDDVESFRLLDPSGDRVALTGTFSKCFSPGLRIGWGILPKDLALAVKQQKDNFDFGTANLNQQILLAVLESGSLAEHIQRLRQVYGAKRDVIDRAMHDLLAPLGCVRWVRPLGGIYVWVELPEDCDTGIRGPLFDLAVKSGMLYVPGEYFFPPAGEPVQHHYARLSFGVPSEERLRRGVEAFAHATQNYLSNANC